MTPSELASMPMQFASGPVLNFEVFERRHTFSRYQDNRASVSWLRSISPGVYEHRGLYGSVLFDTASPRDVSLSIYPYALDVERPSVSAAIDANGDEFDWDILDVVDEDNFRPRDAVVIDERDNWFSNAGDEICLTLGFQSLVSQVRNSGDRSYESSDRSCPSAQGAYPVADAVLIACGTPREFGQHRSRHPIGDEPAKQRANDHVEPVNVFIPTHERMRSTSSTSLARAA